MGDDEVIARVVHLSGGSFDVIAARLVRSDAGLGDGRLRCVAHCLVLETERDGLVVVDTGLGTREVAEPARIPLAVRLELRPRLRPEETLSAQLRAAGYDPADVRHVVFTHLDLDHACGLADFPEATAHAMTRELRRALSVRRPPQRLRFAPAPLREHRTWRTYAPGDATLGPFGRVRFVDGLDDEVALVPLPGHGPDHCGVAVWDASGWLLHAGDAYLDRAELDGAEPGLHQRLVETSRRDRRRSVEVVRAARAAGWAVVCAHDAAELEAARNA